MDVVFNFDWPKNHGPNYWAGEALGTAISATPRVNGYAIYMH